MTDAVAPFPSAADTLAPPAGTPASGGSPVSFTGVRGDFRRLIMRGALLELVTLGFYRFWLATDMRRHFWSHTSVGGDAPEYTGTAKELLIGFLFALAILVPIYLVYFFIGFEAERWQAFASVPLVLFFFLFFQFAMYRARRYRLTRTVWRGVRFWMKGSGWSYAWRVGLWTLLVIMTLGLALPWYQAALERFKMRHSFYGHLQGRFDGTGGALFSKIWWLWVPFLPLVLLIYGAVAFLVMTSWRPELVDIELPGGAAPMYSVLVDPIVGILYFSLVSMWSIFAYAIYKACEWRWWMSGIRFGEVRFESKLTAGSFIGLYWKVIGWSLLILVVLMIWFGGLAGALYAAFGGENASPEAMAMAFQSPSFLIAVVAGYIICALAFGVVVRLYLRRDVWAKVVASTVIYNLSAADNVTARGEAANALGEGFADSLDIGGF